MAIFDQVGNAQSANGVGPPNMQTTHGIPGFTPGGWGNQPGAGAPNFAAGLQQFQGAPGNPAPGGNPLMQQMPAFLQGNPQLAQLMNMRLQQMPQMPGQPAAGTGQLGGGVPGMAMPQGSIPGAPGGSGPNIGAGPNLAGGLASYLRR
jgi:hypothetical protein